MLTITIAPAGKGTVTATSSDGHTFLTTIPLCTGARHWLDLGAAYNTPICTIWSTGNGDPSLKSTVGYAARHTVLESQTEGPRFVKWAPFPSGKLREAVSSA